MCPAALRLSQDYMDGMNKAFSLSPPWRARPQMKWAYSLTLVMLRVSGCVLCSDTQSLNHSEPRPLWDWPTRVRSDAAVVHAHARRTLAQH